MRTYLGDYIKLQAFAEEVLRGLLCRQRAGEGEFPRSGVVLPAQRKLGDPKHCSATTA